MLELIAIDPAHGKRQRAAPHPPGRVNFVVDKCDIAGLLGQIGLLRNKLLNQRAAVQRERLFQNQPATLLAQRAPAGPARQLAIERQVVGHCAIIGVVVIREGVKLTHGKLNPHSSSAAAPSSAMPTKPTISTPGLMIGSKRGFAGRCASFLAPSRTWPGGAAAGGSRGGAGMPVDALGPPNGGIGALFRGGVPVGRRVSPRRALACMIERATDTTMLSATNPAIRYGTTLEGSATTPLSARRSRLKSGPPAITRMKISQPSAEPQLILPLRFSCITCLTSAIADCRPA